MATVVWAKRAHEEKENLYLNGRLEFGVTVANKTAQKIQEIEISLTKYHQTGFIEPLLKDKTQFLYRSGHINKRFKIIYRYDEPNDTVVIEDIWDTRRNPKNLMGRIKKQKC